LLGAGLYKFEEYVTYKAEREGKPVFKVSPVNTSRECAACRYNHPDNRRTQSVFRCQSCGHTDNADRNAAVVIKKRAVNLILHPGTGLSGRRGNVLTPAGTDAKPRKTREAKATRAAACPSKKKAVTPLEARSFGAE
jgi:putative transposase